MSYKNKSNYKSFQVKKKRFNQLEVGLTGFLCTCNNKLKEKSCIWEAYSILNEYADELFGPEEPQIPESEAKNEIDVVKNNDDDSNEEDIDQALKKEVLAIKAKLNRKIEARRFQAIQSGANGIVFIRTTVPDPVKLAHHIVKSLSSTQKSKFLLRLLPIELTCKAYIEDICNACDPLFDKYFTGEGKTFAVIFNHRNNERLKRDEVIEKVAELVVKKSEKNKADLKNPQLAILIEVIRSICCISVVPDFYTLKKYNLLELAIQNNNSSNEPKDNTEKSFKDEYSDQNNDC